MTKLRFGRRNWLTTKLWLVGPYERRTKNSPYTKLLVFKDAFLMRGYLQSLNDKIGNFKPKGYWEKTAAAATGWSHRRGASKQVRRYRGNVCFHAGFIGVGVVAHEMTHSAMYFMRHKRWPVTIRGPHDDEKLAGLVGELVRQFWVWHNRHAK
jgi:hypothetical protein